MNSRSWILRFVALVAVLVGTPLAAVRYQAAIFDPDIWWHMRVGEFIASTHSFPHTAVFTRFADTNSWFAYSWVFEILVAQLHRWWSLPALPAFLYVMQVVIALALFEAARAVARSFWPAALLTGFAFLAIFHTLSLRPVLFSVLFFIAEMALITLALRERSPRFLYWTPAVFFLWANCHIQFINGLLVLALLAVCLLLQQLLATRLDEAPELSWTSALVALAGSVVATLISPYSVRLYSVIWGYVSRAAQWDQITELAAPDFRRPAHYLLVLLAAAAAMSLGIRRSRSLFRIAVLGFSTIVALHAVRDAWFAAVVSVLLLAEAFASPEPEVETSAERLLPSLAALAALVVAFASQASVGFSTPRLIAQLDRMYPVRAASYLADTHPQGPLFNSVNWGGYLIYNLREYPVSADGRSDAYGGTFGENLRVTQGKADWRQDPVFASSNVILLERQRPLAALLAADPDFRLVYQDHIAEVFLRVHPAKMQNARP